MFLLADKFAHFIKSNFCIYNINEWIKVSNKLKSPGFQTFLACVLLFHVKILETEQGEDYSDLEFKLLLGTFDKFMMRDIRTR